ncbi:MAG: zinc finger domain-containing protein [Methanomicrobiales archaeon]|nr:zinc finger domain-containing protein [Methanomicrobiales archaeon]
MSMMKCSSCGAPAVEKGAVEFGCPECGEPLCRCVRCRQQSVPYVCRKCSFRGP